MTERFFKQEEGFFQARVQCKWTYYHISPPDCVLIRSISNYAAWTRGDRADYDLWGKMVNDRRWSYDGLLPYFRKTESHHDPQADPHQHGFHGPIHSTPASSNSNEYFCSITVAIYSWILVPQG